MASQDPINGLRQVFPIFCAFLLTKSVDFVEKELRKQEDDEGTGDQETAPTCAVLSLVLYQTSSYPVKDAENASAHRINEPEDRRYSAVSFLLRHGFDEPPRSLQGKISGLSTVPLPGNAQLRRRNH